MPSAATPHGMSPRPTRKAGKAGIDDRGILALEKADAADLVAERDVQVGKLAAQDLGGAELHGRGHRREDRGYRGRPEALGADVCGDAQQLLLVQRGDHLAIEFVAAAQHVGVPAQCRSEIGRPVDERRQALGCRQADADRRDLEQPLPLDHGIGEMRRADRHRFDAARIDVGVGEDLPKDVDDAGAHVRGRRRLAGAEHPLFVHQDGVGISAADVDSHAHADLKYFLGERRTTGRSKGISAPGGVAATPARSIQACAQRRLIRIWS